MLVGDWFVKVVDVELIATIARATVINMTTDVISMTTEVATLRSIADRRLGGITSDTKDGSLVSLYHDRLTGS
jgi:hypothetical protein